jgi:hypothetical protein
MPRRQEYPPPSCWTPEYSLRHCEGYAVFEEGARVGYVEAVPEREGVPHSLLVRVGEVFAHIVAFSVEAVEAVDPTAERFYVALTARVPDEQLCIAGVGLS